MGCSVGTCSFKKFSSVGVISSSISQYKLSGVEIGVGSTKSKDGKSSVFEGLFTSSSEGFSSIKNFFFQPLHFQLMGLVVVEVPLHWKQLLFEGFQEWYFLQKQPALNLVSFLQLKSEFR